MQFERDLSDLMYLAAIVGNDPSLVQGGGGNISVKLSDGTMAIKASGVRLKEMGPNHGIAFVNQQKIKQHIDLSAEASTSTFIECIHNNTLDKFGWKRQKPSIETGFHVILDKFTIHSHSVHANVLTCSHEGRAFVKDMFPHAHWIDYVSPGDLLTSAIYRAHIHAPYGLYFLQNHGLITSAATAKACLEMHREVVEKLSKKFQLQTFADFAKERKCPHEISDKFLFPDQVVYASSKDLIHTMACKETITVYEYLLEAIFFNKLSPRFLEGAEIDIINNMESEKMRKGMAK